jgi:hypothetical protein
MSSTNDTALFVRIKQSGGWTIYSTDTRVPPIVAQSDNGSFEELMQIESAKLWIQSMAEDMAVIKTLPNEELNFSQDEITNNISFWESISCPDEYVKESLLQTAKVLKDTLVIKDSLTFENPTLSNGHYEYAYTTSYSEVYDSIQRMTVTDWHQRAPYNEYCPLKSDNETHAPAGCVAIAGAQMLFYLHDYYGVPSTAPSEAYCEGNINSYTWNQTNYTTDIWESMNNNGIYAAPLIADVGRRIDMDYQDDASGAYMQDLVQNVFVPYGISCVYAKYDTELLKNSLINKMPVLLSAYSKKDNGTTRVGHAFIADKYKRTHTVTEIHYNWVFDYEDIYTELSLPPEKIEYSYDSPSIDMIGINWGWGPDYNTNEWFCLTGDWIKEYHTSSYNWNISRYMIHDFQVIN